MFGKLFKAAAGAMGAAGKSAAGGVAPTGGVAGGGAMGGGVRGIGGRLREIASSRSAAPAAPKRTLGSRARSRVLSGKR